MNETINGFHTLNLASVRKMFNNDSACRKANKSANQVIINLLDLVNNDNLKITCEMAKGGTILNRGSVAECLIKLWLLDNKSAKKYGAGKVDLKLNNTNYEIKLSTSKGYATYNAKQNYKNVIFINQYGIYETNSSAFILDNCRKHIKNIKMNKDTKVLVEWAQ